MEKRYGVISSFIWQLYCTQHYKHKHKKFYTEIIVLAVVTTTQIQKTAMNYKQSHFMFMKSQKHA